jgi:hypothetical protein
MTKIIYTILFFFASFSVFSQDSAYYPYHSEEITFENSEAGITLADTLTVRYFHLWA